jgi:sulfoxide reductase heme-binding subunit YedZ
MTKSQWIRFIIKPIVFLLCLFPLGLLIFNAFTGRLSANPIDDITDTTGTWTLRFLMITLAITPLHRITGLTALPLLRRMFGLYAFFYASLHFTTYIYLDKFFEWEEIVKDVYKRPFITVGFTSFVLLIPLAITSTNKMVKRLGGKKWKLLHRLIYFIATGGVIHYYWLVKADVQRPLIYGAILFVLLGYRLWMFFQSQHRN